MNHQFLKSLLVCNLLAIICWIGVAIALKLVRGGGRNIELPVKTPLLLIFSLYLVSIISITLIPLRFSTYRIPSKNDINLLPVVRSVKIFLYPFKANRMALLPDIIENIVGNILMFMPLGCLLPQIHKKFLVARNIIFTAFLFSVFIESAQWLSRLFGNYRHVDVDDVILNTLGTALGFFGYWLFISIKTKRNKTALEPVVNERRE